jgi:hypothetical protein
MSYRNHSKKEKSSVLTLWDPRNAKVNRNFRFPKGTKMEVSKEKALNNKKMMAITSATLISENGHYKFKTNKDFIFCIPKTICSPLPPVK